MPAETRSRGKAPPSRVYHSSPAPAQLEFPRRRKVVKTYTRHSTSARSLRQSTLTQIGYVEPFEPQDFDMELTPDKRPHKRRKTMGDTPTSSFHTQTLTQFLSTAGDDEDVQRFDSDDKKEEEESDDDEPKALARKTERPPRKALSHVTDSRATSIIPQTPVHKKAKADVWEVPSSQPTPGTPLAPTPQDTERFRIQPLRSPLQERSSNVNADLPTLPPPETAMKRPLNMVIEDSYNSAPGLPSSDPIQPSPFKVPRLPYITEAASARASMELGEFGSGEGLGKAPATRTRRPLAEIDIEIPDSDDELLSLGPTPVKSNAGDAFVSKFGDITPSQKTLPLPTTPKVSTDEDEREIESSDAEYYDPGSPTPVARKLRSIPRPSPPKPENMDNAPSSSAADGPSPLRMAATSTTPSRAVQPGATEEGLPTSTPFMSQHTAPRSSAVRNNSSQSRTMRAEDTEQTQYDDSQDELVAATPPVTTQKSTARSPPSQNTRSSRSRTAQLVVIELPDDTREVDLGADLVTLTPPVAPQRSARSSQSRGTRSRRVLPGESQEPNVTLAAPPVDSQHSAPRSTQSRSSRSRTGQAQAPEDIQDNDLTQTTPPVSSQRPGPRSSQSRTGHSRRVQIQAPGDNLDDDVTQGTSAGKSQFYTQTQGLESQRIPLEVIRTMAPQTDRSDIILSIHPEPMELIANGLKTHEFRNYSIPNTVSRMWMYITVPIQELRYMAAIGPAKQPGEIDDNGIGNREFNAGTSGCQYAYELLQVYQINNPVSLATMKQKGWAEGAPQKYIYLRPAIVGQLLGNLRCALFDDESHPHHEESQQQIMSTPQQIEDQLLSDIIHSTQLAPEGATNRHAIVLSSQTQSQTQNQPSQNQRTPAAKRTSDDVFARRQLPASKTPASVQRLPPLPRLASLPRLPRNQDVNAVRPSQATTASDVSSPAVSPEKSLPRPVMASSGPAFPDYGVDDSPIGFEVGQHYSLGSSQLRVPESLMRDDIRPPPDIRDSDDEDFDDDY
ncbi:hypothetical protein GE09DRAFT_1134109 [Coniochaeta sp. 2T2.1]|nr:hypothetical protein GE09DRAFT_1134109 [Coniochaeta sp. 2T2.1]